MYRKHFALTRHPFDKHLAAADLFETQALSELTVRLTHLLDMRGLGLVTGESGSGKTTAVRRLVAGLNTGLHRVLYVTLTTGNVMDLYKTIAWELGLPTERNRATLFRRIRGEVSRLCSENHVRRRQHQLGGVRLPEREQSHVDAHRIPANVQAHQTLLDLVRLDVAKELMFTGRVVDGTEAVKLGLATRATELPVEDALVLAKTLASKNPHAIRAGKQLLDSARELSVKDAFVLETELQLGLLGSANNMEAVQANMQQRAPVFQDPD